MLDLIAGTVTRPICVASFASIIAGDTSTNSIGQDWEILCQRKRSKVGKSQLGKSDRKKHRRSLGQVRKLKPGKILSKHFQTFSILGISLHYPKKFPKSSEILAIGQISTENLQSCHKKAQYVKVKAPAPPATSKSTAWKSLSLAPQGFRPRKIIPRQVKPSKCTRM